VEANVLLATEPRRTGFVRRAALRRRYEQLAADAGFELPAGRPAGGLRVGEQQQVEILRALSRDAQLIVMDEPAAALSGPDTEQLHRVIRALADRDKTILLISHFLDEVLALADTVTILRDGRLVRTAPAAEETEDSLIQGMLGRPLGAAYPEVAAVAPDAPDVLRVESLSAPGVRGASLHVKAGEIVGLAGLVGSGRSELGRAIFGASPRTAGSVVAAGASDAGRTPRANLRNGMAMIPESRKDQGLLFARSVTENASLATLHRFTRAGLVRRGAERAATEQILDRCAVRSDGYSAAVGSLSGGNQQKVLFARMLMCSPSLLIADEPTRGVDVGAKRAIYDLLAGLAEQGLGVLLISSELEEILGLAHRTLVMRGGRLVAELRGNEMTESAILAAAFAEVPREESAA
ncbi:MAG: ribose transport system ATP-binding protein, partial [Thermoleophilales bacterium]|nr:ribose transport system ATP-binding protein [Thermoleophilales bacterium]